MSTSKRVVGLESGARVSLHQAFRCCPYAALITAKLHDFFVQNGCEITTDLAAASLQVINTCGFNESRTIQAEDSIAHHRQSGPDVPMVVVGCLTRIAPERVMRGLDPEGRWTLIGPHDHQELDGLFEAPKVVFEKVHTNLYNDRYSHGDPRMGLYQVLVATGCLNKCTYCVIRKAKGTVKSRCLEDILTEVERAARLGHRDVLLVGDDVSVWGVDLGLSVVDLLSALSRTSSDIRFSVEAFEPSRLLPHLDELIDVFALGRISWIVFPVQSGSDRVLAAMDRRYTTAQVKDGLSRMRAAAPDMFISTDLIFGFGDETEEEFEQTMALGALFDHCDWNEYEQRPGTPPSKASSEQMQRRRDRVAAHRREQGEQVQKLVFCEVSESPPPDLVGEPDAAPPDHGDAGVENKDYTAASPWVLEHAARVQELLREHGAALDAGWRVDQVDLESERVVLALSHDEAPEPMAYMLTPPDDQAPAIASSKDYNLGLIWESPAPCHLDEGQIAALGALQTLLGMRSRTV